MATSKKGPPSYFTAFHISSEMNMVLRSYAIMEGIPISQVLRKITQKWVNDEELTEERIIEGLFYSMRLDWDIVTLENQLREKKMDGSSIVSKEEFIKSWETKLEILPIPMLEKVIEKFKNETD